MGFDQRYTMAGEPDSIHGFPWQRTVLSPGLDVVGIIRLFFEGIKLMAFANRNDLESGLQEERHFLAPLCPMRTEP